MYARFGIGSLLLLRPRLKEINVNDFVFNAQHDSDTGRWNLAALEISIPKGGSGEMPLVRLEGGTLQYSKVSKGQTEVVAAVPLDVRFGPAGKTQDDYIFNITTAERADSGKSTLTGFRQPGRITIDGAISSDAYSLKLKVKELLSIQEITGEIFAFDKPAFLEAWSPFTALQRFLNRYRPAGKVDIDLQASGNLNRLSGSTLVGKVYCKDVSIFDRKFPYSVERIVGRIDFTEKSMLLNNLSGEHGNVRLFFNGWSRDFGANRKYYIQITSDNMALDDDLYNALSAKQKKFWSTFSPSGFAAIDYRRSRQSQTDKKTTLAVELLDAEAVYHRFAYPLKNLTGKLLFARDSVIVSDVVSQYEGRKITLDGQVTACNTNRPIYDISVKANNIPLDSTLAVALPDKQRHFYNELDMAGLADAEVEIFTPEQDVGPTGFAADVSFKETSLRVPVLQQRDRKAGSRKVNQSLLVISDISAKAVFTSDLIRIGNFTGQYDGGLVSLTGRIRPGREDEQPRYYLSLDAEQAELNDDLFSLLPAPLEKIVSKLQPKGKVNLSADLNNADSGNYPDYKITVDCLGNSINFERFAYPLKDITGRLTITADSIKLEDITATAANDVQITPASTIKINGQIVLGPPNPKRKKNTFGEPLAGDVTLIADGLRIKGKTLTRLKTDIYYDPYRQSWLTKNLIADCYDGKLTGKLELKQSAEADWEYLLQVGFDNIDLKQFLSDATQNSKFNGYTSGKMNGSLSVAGRVGDSLPRIGRCRLAISDMQVGKLSPLAKLLGVLKLTEPKDFAFDRMLVDSYIKHNKLFFRQLDLSGQAVAFNGSGWVDLQSQDVDLTLTARGRRLATAEPSILQSLTDVLGQAVVRMEVTGNFYDPQITTTTLPVIKDSLKILGTAR